MDEHACLIFSGSVRMTANSVEGNGCHCGTVESFAACCGRFLQGAALPQTAQQLMQSRYSGFVCCDEAYLLATWHPQTRPSKVRFDAKQNWLGLRILATQAGGTSDSTGTVEFVARFKIDGKGHRLHELSRFEKVDGRWCYLDGQHL